LAPSLYAVRRNPLPHWSLSLGRITPVPQPRSRPAPSPREPRSQPRPSPPMPASKAQPAADPNTATESESDSAPKPIPKPCPVHASVRGPAPKYSDPPLAQSRKGPALQPDAYADTNPKAGLPPSKPTPKRRPAPAPMSAAQPAYSKPHQRQAPNRTMVTQSSSEPEPEPPRSRHAPRVADTPDLRFAFCAGNCGFSFLDHTSTNGYLQMQACIAEWRTGQYKPSDLRFSRQQPFFDAHLHGLLKYPSVAADWLDGFWEKWYEYEL
jgi:hypothetical protein